MNERIVFMGTPEFAVPILRVLIENYNVVGVVTQPDKEVGRKQELNMSPIKKLALEYNVKVLQPKKIKEDYKDILDLNPDIIITCAYGQIVPKEVLEFPKYKCINVHASLLPKYRGGSPIHRAIQNGDEKTGITIMYMEEALDSGDIISVEEIKLEYTDNLEIVHDKLSELGKNLLLDTLPKIFNNDIHPIRQKESEVSFAFNIKREEEKLDFYKTSNEVYNHIRAFNPFPGTYFELDEEIFKVWKAEETKTEYSEEPGVIVKAGKDEVIIRTKTGGIKLIEIQPSGKGKMNIKDYMNGKGSEVFKVGRKCK